MAIIKTRMSRLNAAKQVALGRQVVTKMTGNPLFPLPSPTLAAITAQANALEASANAAQAARASAKAATSARRDNERAMARLLNQVAAYVENVTAGDRTEIQSAGFDVRNVPSPVGSLPAPMDLELDANLDPGHMGLRWKTVPGASGYVVERALDGAAPLDYVTVANPTNTKVRVNGMVSGSRYWFRVAAVGAAGTGLRTLEVSKIAP
jgi:hypothetical protein